MKIVYREELARKYTANPVENSDRVIEPARLLRGCGWQFKQLRAAQPEDISRVHGREHIEDVRRMGLYEPAALAAGGAITAAKLALQGEPAFALVRPPGHHAAANRAWGMCYFNNMAIAVKNIRQRAKKALIIDIDLHYGDGKVSIFRGDSNVKIVNPWSVDESFEYLNMDGSRYLSQVEDAFQNFDYDIVGVSAGFDTYLEDWGKLLKKEDICRIGKVIKEGAKMRDGHRFAVLEGGYHPDLKWCIKSFLEGFE
jgi:acetoin utilization deacetylase AcuC-like enzyme